MLGPSISHPVYDMHGNVNEWCLDWYSDSLSGGVTDPKGPSSGSGRVLRGGCWNASGSACTSSNRGGQDPWTIYTSGTYGFRIVRTLVD